jgi:hypothetical protein
MLSQKQARRIKILLWLDDPNKHFLQSLNFSLIIIKLKNIFFFPLPKKNIALA